MQLAAPMSKPGDLKDTRRDGTPRQVLFSDHALLRLRQRLPRSHVFQRMQDDLLADRIEKMVIDLSRISPPPLVDDPQGERYQWELDLGPRLGMSLIAVLKDHGSWGNRLPEGQRILVTFIHGTGFGRKASRESMQFGSRR